jgi:hypothetical protein
MRKFQYPLMSGMRRLPGSDRRQSGPCPYCIPHLIKLKRDDWLTDMKFEKWCKRDRWPANALYWRLHRNEMWWTGER